VSTTDGPQKGLFPLTNTGVDVTGTRRAVEDHLAALTGEDYETLSAEPFQPFVDKLELTRFFELDIPKSFRTPLRTSHCRQGSGAGIRAPWL
jgi:hypothetical protein